MPAADIPLPTSPVPAEDTGVAQSSTASASSPSDIEKLTGAQKAAALLTALGVDTASQILRHLDDEMVEKVSIEVARLKNASSDLVEGVLLEYRDMARAREYVAQGGVAYARQVLDEALGTDRADEIMMRVEAAMEVSAFHLLHTVETSQLTNFLRREHPQTAALILANLNPRKSAEIISGLEEEAQSEIMYRLATMGKTSPEMVNDIEEVIRNQLGSVIGTDMNATGGIEQVAEILNTASRSDERAILKRLRERSDGLAASIKDHMFVFDDLVNINDEDLQAVLMEVEQSDLALAMKAAADELKTKVMRNVSERVAETLQEEVELLGRVRVNEVEEAQRRILEKAQQLEEEEKIVLSNSPEQLLE